MVKITKKSPVFYPEANVQRLSFNLQLILLHRKQFFWHVIDWMPFLQ